MVIGKKVQVIFSDQNYRASFNTPYPEIGTIGIVTSEFDSVNECDVFFPTYLCPVELDVDWITHERMIVFLDEDLSSTEISITKQLTEVL